MTRFSILQIVIINIIIRKWKAHMC